MKQIQNIYEKYWLDIGAFLLIAFLAGGGLFLMKISREEKAPIEIVETTEVEGVRAANDDKDKEEKVLNINTATQDELEALPGIGEKTAEKIIDYREENGDFTSKDDLKNVSGIGDAKYSEIEDLITVE